MMKANNTVLRDPTYRDMLCAWKVGAKYYCQKCGDPGGGEPATLREIQEAPRLILCAKCRRRPEYID